MHKIKDSFYFRPSRANLVSNIIYHEFKHNKNKNPYILVLSDRTEHLDFMYQNLPEKLKEYAVVFHGKLKVKEKREKEALIDSKKIRVIFRASIIGLTNTSCCISLCL